MGAGINLSAVQAVGFAAQTYEQLRPYLDENVRSRIETALAEALSKALGV